MKRLIPIILAGLLLCVLLTSCSAGAAGVDTSQPSISDISTQPYIETTDDMQSATIQPSTDGTSTELTATQEQVGTAGPDTGVKDTTEKPVVQPTKVPAQTDPGKKPVAIKVPDATEKTTLKPTDKPKETQAPTTKPTQAPTQPPTQAPTLVPEGNYIAISINGYDKKEILKSTVMEFSDGDTVFDLIKKATRDNKIQMEFKGSGMMAYIEGIDNVYEFDHGSQSGWMYKVNDIYPEVSCGRYKVKAGDIVEFMYSENMGKDRREG